MSSESSAPRARSPVTRRGIRRVMLAVVWSLSWSGKDADRRDTLQDLRQPLPALT